jgi:hypothetical protein
MDGIVVVDADIPAKVHRSRIEAALARDATEPA